jgi:hypothetical protein
MGEICYCWGGGGYTVLAFRRSGDLDVSESLLTVTMVARLSQCMECEVSNCWPLVPRVVASLLVLPFTVSGFRLRSDVVAPDVVKLHLIVPDVS